MALRSPRRDSILSPNTPLCGPFMGRSDVDKIPVANNLITVREFFEPITEANRYGEAAVDQATAAIEGLQRLLLERDKPRETLIGTYHYGEWEKPHVQALRTAIYAMVGSTKENPQRVRDDIRDGEPDGTIITKGQAGPNAPLFLVEKTTRHGGRRLDVLDGRPQFMDGVMTEVNAFSPMEYRRAAAYVTSRSADPAFIQRILTHANRYTVPTMDALYGAFQWEANGRDVVSSWGPAFNAYPQRIDDPIPA